MENGLDFAHLLVNLEMVELSNSILIIAENMHKYGQNQRSISRQLANVSAIRKARQALSLGLPPAADITGTVRMAAATYYVYHTCSDGGNRAKSGKSKARYAVAALLLSAALSGTMEAARAMLGELAYKKKYWVCVLDIINSGCI
jgi:hypothetical protein